MDTEDLKMGRDTSISAYDYRLLFIRSSILGSIRSSLSALCDFAPSELGLDFIRFLGLGIVILRLGNDTSRLGEMFLTKEVSFPEPGNGNECFVSEELRSGD